MTFIKLTPDNEKVSSNKRSANKLVPDEVNPMLPKTDFSHEGNFDVEAYKSYMPEGIYDNEYSNEIRATRQSNLEKLGHGLAKTANELVTGSLKAITDIPDNIKSTINQTSIVEKDFTNDVSDWLGQFKENIDKNNPIYIPQAEKGFSPSSFSWWAENLPSIASAATFIVPTLAASKTIGLGVKGLNALGKSSKGIPVLQNLLIGNKTNRLLQGVGGTLYSNLAESMQDAIPLAQQKYQEALDAGIPEDKAREIGAKAGWDVYTGNLANVALDLPSTFAMLKGFKSSRNLVTKKSVVNTLEKEVIPEGIQESVNYISKEEAERKADISIGNKEDDNSSLTQRVIDKYMQDPDMWTSTFFGAIGGAVFQGINSAKDSISGQNKKDSDLRNIQNQRLTEIGALHNKPELFKEGQDNLLFEQAYSNAKTGTSEAFIDKLKEIQSYSDEQIKELGLDRSLIEDRIQKAKEIEDTYNDTVVRFGESEGDIDFNKIITQTSIDKKNKLKDLTSVNGEISSKKASLMADANQYEDKAISMESIDVPFLRERINELARQKAYNTSVLNDIKRDPNLKAQTKKTKFKARKAITDRLNAKLDIKLSSLQKDLELTKKSIKEANKNLSQNDEAISEINLDKYPQFNDLKDLISRKVELEQAIAVNDIFYNKATTVEGREELSSNTTEKSKAKEEDIKQEETQKVNEEKVVASKEQIQDIKDKKESIDSQIEIPQDQSGESFNREPKVLTPEEIISITHNTHINTPILKDGQFDGVTTKQKDLEEKNIKASLLKETLRDESIAPDGRIIGIGDLIQDAASAIAYLSREKEEVIMNGKKSIHNIDNKLNPELQEASLLSHYEYQVGDRLILEVDKSFSITKGDGTIINYQSLREREIKEGKQDLLVPIAVKNSSNKIVGYIHDIDWINSENVHNVDSNIEKQKNILKELRNKISKNGSFETTITSKSYGRLSKNIEGKKKTVTESFPDSNLKFSIAKRGQLHSGIDKPLILEDEQLINKEDTVYLNGAIYAILPTPVQAKSLAVRLDTKKLGNEYSNSIISVIKAFYDKKAGIRDEILKHTGINIFTEEGLKQYINLFTYSGSFTKEDVKLAKGNDAKKFLDIINGSIVFASGGGLIRNINSTDTLNKNREELVSHLENTYTSLFLTNLETNKSYKISIVKGEEVSNKVYDKYTDFIKDHTETNLNSYKLSNNEYAYFDQPVILFESNPTIQRANIESVANFSLASNEESKGIQTDSNDGVIDIASALKLNKDEDYSPNITNEGEDIIKKAMEDVLIPGFTSAKQNEIVTFLAAQVYYAIHNGTTSVESVFAKYHTEFLKSKEDHRIAPILSNWNKFKSFALRKANQNNEIKFKSTTDLDNIESLEDTDSLLEKTNFDDEGSFQIDPKDGLSSRLKSFFSFISTRERNYLGLPTYMTADEVMNNLSAMLANQGSNYLDLKAILLEKGKTIKWLKYSEADKNYGLIAKLDNASEQLKNEFTVYVSKHYAPFKIVFWNENKYGMSMKVADADQNSVAKVIIESWIDNMKELPIVEESKEVPGELVLSKIEREKLVNEFKDLQSNPTSEKLTNWLDQIGVDLSSETLSDVINNPKKIFGLSFKELFTDRSGVFKVMNDKLRGAETEEISEDLIYLNNPLDDNAGIRALAKLEANYTNIHFSNSHKNVEGKTIFSYSLNKYFTNKFRELTTNKKLVNDLLQTSFSSTSSWLKGLSEEGYFKDKFNFFYFDGLKKTKSKQLGVKLKDQSAREHEITKLGLFFNQGNYRNLGNAIQRVANFLYPTMSDKTTMLGITALAHDTKLNPDNTLGEETLDALFSIVEAEYKRISKFQKLKAEGKEPKIDGYSIGAEKFIFFSELNNYTDLWADKKLLELKPQDIKTIKNYLSETISKLIEDKKKEWEKLGVYTTKKNSLQLKFIDKSYITNIVDKKLESKNDENRLQYAASDYVVNYLIANTNAFQTFIGDPALFWKKNIDETLINIGKRLAKEIAPGLDIPNSENLSYRQILLSDKKSVSSTIEYLEKLLGVETAKSYRDIEGTDAQEYTTLEEHLFIMTSIGKISTEQYNDFLDKGKKGILSLKELSIVLQPMKPVYSQNILDLDTDVNRSVYIKSSSFPLIPQLTKGLEIDKLRRVMENNKNLDGSPAPIARAAYKTAVKVGGSDFINIWNEDGTIKNNIPTDKYLTLPRSGFRIQQEVPFDDEKDKIVKGSQETKLLFVNLREVPGMKELEQEYTNLHGELYSNSSKELDEELLTDGKLDLVKLRDTLKKEAISRNYPLNDIQALELIDGKFRLPLWASSSSNKIESLLSSIVDNKVRKKKMKGFSGVLASEDGFIGNSLKGDIIWMDGYDPQVGLKGMREEDGIIKPAQIIAPFKFKDNNGNLLNVKDFIIEGTNRLDHTKLPKELLQSFGFRIPTQGLNSMSYIEVVGFLPYEMGDLTIVPRDFTKQMGSDYDVDKLYIYQYNTTYNEGILGKYQSEENTEKSIQNKLLDIHITVLSNNDSRIQKQVLAPLDSDILKDLANKYKDTNNTVTLLSDTYQRTKFINGTQGKMGTATFALDATFNAIIQKFNIFINKEVGPLVFGDENGKEIKGNKFSEEDTVTENRKKSEIISSYLSAHVDNEKEQIAEKINANGYTFDTIRAFNQFGFEEKFVVPLLVQPIIKEYVEEMKRAKDSTIEEFIANPKQEVVENLRNKYLEQAGLKGSKLTADYPLTVKEMNQQLESSTPEIQLAILDKFIKARDIGEAIQKVQSAINTDSKGLGKNLFESLYKEQQVRRLFEDSDSMIQGASSLIGKLKDNEIIPTTINGFATVNALFKNNQLWKDLFPYGNLGVDKVFQEISAIRNKQLTSQDQKDVWDNIKSFIYTNQSLNLTDVNIDQERKRLMYDTADISIDENGEQHIIKRNNISFASRWKVYKNTLKGKKNAFATRTTTDININSKASLVKYNAAAGENLDELNVYQSFVDGLLDTETRELFQDAVLYFYVTGGIQEAVQFGKYIPVAYLNAIGFSDNIRDIDFNNESVLGTTVKNQYYQTSEFTKQFFQNNPYLAPKLKDDLSQITEKKLSKEITMNPENKDLLVPRFISEVENVLDVPVEFVTIFDGKKQRLYQYIGDYKYKEIPVFTEKFITQYNANVVPNIPSTRELKQDNRDEVIKDTESKPYINSIKKDVLISQYSLDKSELSSNVFKEIVENSSNPWFREVAKILYNNNSLLKDVKLESSNENFKGSYSNDTKTIKYNIKNIDSKEDLERVILHESIHGLLNDTISNPKTQEQKDLILSLERMRGGLLEKINADPKWKAEYDSMISSLESKSPIGNSEILSRNYGATKLTEFVTMIMTDKGFQEILNNISFNGEKTFLSRFKAIINKILQSIGFPIKENSLLERAITNIVDLTSTIGYEESETQSENIKKVPIIKENEIILSNGKKIIPNSEQISALENMKEWGNDSKALFFTLSGYAGTGKSTIVGEFIKDFKKTRRNTVGVSAPTHKAKKVIARSTRQDAFTIQALLGLRPNTDLENFDINNPQFDVKAEKKIQEYKAIIIDEASMLNKDLFTLLINEAKQSGTKILFMGDPAQLPPVKESISEVFSSKEITHKAHLSKVERQADGNPLMSIYDAIRNNLKDTNDSFIHETKINNLGEGVKFYKNPEEFSKEVIGTFKSVDFQNDPDYAKILSWTNTSVKYWNNEIRQAIYGKESKHIEKGELLFAYNSILNSWGEALIENSADYKVTNVSSSVKENITGYNVSLSSVDTKKTSEVFVIKPEEVNYKKFLETFNKKLERAKSATGRDRGIAWREYYGFKEQFLLLEDIRDSRGNLIVKKDLDYGYAITIHKSQGSTYNRVFVLENVIDSNKNSEERNKLKYVALSRPTTKAVVLSNKTTSNDEDQSPTIESKLNLRNDDGSRKRSISYQQTFDKVKEINTTTSHKAKLIRIKGEESDKRIYYSIKIVSDEDLSPMISGSKPKIQYKEIIENRELRISELNKQIANSSKDREKLGELIDKKKKLEIEVKELQDDATLQNVIDLGHSDLKEVTNILSQDKLSESDLFYSRNILNNLENYLKNLFNESDLETDSDGEYSANVQEVQSIIAKASTLSVKLTNAEQSATLNLVNKITNKNYKISDIILQNEISALSANFLDISRSGNPLLDSLDKLMRDASFASNQEATKIFDEVDQLVDKIKKNSLFKELGYKLFAQKNSDGTPTGNIVNPYSQLFYNEKREKLRYAKKKNTQKSWNDFYEWKRDNEIVFDARKLFNSIYVELGGTSYSTSEINKHIKELKTQIGDKQFEELNNRLKDKIELYKKDYQKAQERYSLEIDGAIQASLIDQWVKENSPFYYAQSVYEGGKQKAEGKFITPRGYKYTYEAPRKTTLSGESTKWYDEDFAKIEANEDLYNFYKYMISTFNNMYDVLPESLTEDLQYNYLPEIKKSVMELFNEKGMRAGFIGLQDSFIEAISINELPNNPDNKSLPIFMTGNKLSADEKSYDMGKILKAYSVMALAYKHKSKIEDPLRLINKIVNDSLEKQLNAAGDQSIDRFGNPINKKGLKNVKEQVEHTMNSFYGKGRKIQGVTEKKVLTYIEKQQLKTIKGKIAELEQKLESKEITKEEHDIEIKDLEEQSKELGRNIVGSKVGDQVLKYIQLKGMGWNYFNSVTNTLFGFVSNAIEASGGQYYTMKDFHKATSIMLNSTLKSISLNSYANKTSNKINQLMNDYIVIAELYEQTNNSSLTNSKASKGLSTLSPYEAQKRSEYFSQGSTFVALALNTKITSKEGTEINLWEAYDENGKWKSDLFTEEVNNSWNGDINNPEHNKARNLFKGKLEQIKKSIHGNYDPDSSVRIKSGFWGRALMQFRSWIAEGVANRFEEEKEDLYLGTRKGRYRTYGNFYKSTDAFTGTLKLFSALLTKAGKTELSDIDKANMKKNVMELSIYVSLIALAVLAKALGDDDDEEDNSKYVANFLINQSLRLQTDLTFFTSPLAFEKITRTSIPAFGLVKDIQEFAVASKKLVEGNDELKTGPYKGTSRFTREGLQLFPFGNQIYSQYGKIAKTYE